MKSFLTIVLGLAVTGPALAQDYRDYVPDTNRFRAYEHGLPHGTRTKGRVLSFRQVDRDHSGVWEGDEIRHAFGRAAFDAILSFDANADGCISLLEFRAFDDGGRGGPDGVLWERARG